MIKLLLKALKKLVLGNDDLTEEQKQKAIRLIGQLFKVLAEGAAKGAAEGLKK